MSEAKKNLKTDGITVKNIYKEKTENIKIKDILLKSYILFIRKEAD